MKHLDNKIRMLFLIFEIISNLPMHVQSREEEMGY